MRWFFSTQKWPKFGGLSVSRKHFLKLSPLFTAVLPDFKKSVPRSVEKSIILKKAQKNVLHTRDCFKKVPLFQDAVPERKHIWRYSGWMKSELELVQFRQNRAFLTFLARESFISMAIFMKWLSVYTEKWFPTRRELRRHGDVWFSIFFRVAVDSLV